MAAKRITTEVVEGLAPGAQVFDAEVRGFGVRHQGGSPAYFVKTRIKGRQRILTIGRHGQGAWSAEKARREAIRLLGLIRDGHDIANEREAERVAPTLDDFAARYMTEYAERQKKPRTLVEDRRLLAVHILLALGKRKVRDIGKADVARFHASKHASPVAANRALALLSAIMGWAERIGERPDGSNPCRHVQRFPEKARERFLSADELGRVGDALARAQAEGLADWRAVACIRLLLLTGSRLSEILTLRWEWIDMEAGTARLPDSKTGAKTIYLSAPALDVLAALPRSGVNPHVLPGDRPGAPFVGIQKPWQRIRWVAGLPDVHLHDLRHSFASVGIAAGDSLFIVGKLLGHKQASTTERYAHLAPNPARAAADRTGGRIAAMLDGGSAQVVPLRRS